MKHGRLVKSDYRAIPLPKPRLHFPAGWAAWQSRARVKHGRLVKSDYRAIPLPKPRLHFPARLSMSALSSARARWPEDRRSRLGSRARRYGRRGRYDNKYGDPAVQMLHRC